MEADIEFLGHHLEKEAAGSPGGQYPHGPQGMKKALEEILNIMDYEGFLAKYCNREYFSRCPILLILEISVFDQTD